MRRRQGKLRHGEIWGGVVPEVSPHRPRKFVPRRTRPIPARTEDDLLVDYYRYRALRQTALGAHLRIRGPDREEHDGWVPLAHVVGPKLGRIGVPRWLAKERGWRE